jgi:hypothetical protein
LAIDDSEIYKFSISKLLVRTYPCHSPLKPSKKKEKRKKEKTFDVPLVPWLLRATTAQFEKHVHVN